MIAFTACARYEDPRRVRRLYADVRENLRALPGGPRLAEHLAPVVWELPTNARHAPAPEDIIVVIQTGRIVVRIAGRRSTA